jgi:hypothetical protein
VNLPFFGAGSGHFLPMMDFVADISHFGFTPTESSIFLRWPGPIMSAREA